MENNQLEKFDELQANITKAVGPVMEIRVTSQDSMNQAVMALKGIKSWDKMVEAKRVELVTPLNTRVKTINEYAKKITLPIDNAEKHIKNELRTWETKLEAIRREEMKKAAEEEARLKAEAQAKIEAEREEMETLKMFGSEEDKAAAEAKFNAVQERVVTEVSQITTATITSIQSQKVSGATRTWTFEITDETQIPREFLCVDEKKVREAVRSGAREIPGVRIFQDLRISAR